MSPTAKSGASLSAEERVEVVGCEVDPEVRALGDQLEQHTPFVVGDAGVRGRRVQDDRGVGLAGRADRDPPEVLVADVETDLEAEHVAVEGERGIRIGMGQEAGVNRDVHGAHVTDGDPRALLDS